MIAAVLKEPINEKRVSLLPEQVEVLVKKNVEVWVEEGAGQNAFAADQQYVEKGAKIVTRSVALENASIILAIHPISPAEIKKSTLLIGVYQPLFNAEWVNECTSKEIQVFSLDAIPRTTRAQSMDVLSSQANIAGYKAVLTAAQLYPRYFPMFMTAAGSIPPAKMLIIGAGVAGLQAIATARRLGAVVEVFDTRPSVKEEVMSLGAKFVEVEGAADASKAGGYAVEQSEDYKQRQQEAIKQAIQKADLVITTAQIPGKKAPVLITEQMLESMRTGSVIIDLAAATGGNTAVTENNKTIVYKGIMILGDSNLAASMPFDASKLYGRNLLNFMQLLLTPEGTIALNFEDDIVNVTCVTKK